MVLASHVIFAAYGFWLPNDPRGSWSTIVRKWELLQFGPATKVTTRRSVAQRAHDRLKRLAAREVLDYKPVVFDGHQALCIARGFAKMVAKSGYSVYACSILPKHVHMALGRFRYHAETMVRLLKAEASHELSEAGLHPFAEHVLPTGRLPSPWSRNCWKVFLNTPDDIRRAIWYVEQNPVKEGKRAQKWDFVIPYDEMFSGNS
jgi:REP element-mobilizing transposase RayT